MHAAYKDDAKLCEWLRANSSGDYRLAGYAAERVETLNAHLENVQIVCQELLDALKWISEDGHAMASMTIGSRNRLLAALQKYQQSKVTS